MHGDGSGTKLIASTKINIASHVKPIAHRGSFSSTCSTPVPLILLSAAAPFAFQHPRYRFSEHIAVVAIVIAELNERAGGFTLSRGLARGPAGGRVDDPGPHQPAPSDVAAGDRRAQRARAPARPISRRSSGVRLRARARAALRANRARCAGLCFSIRALWLASPPRRQTSRNSR